MEGGGGSAGLGIRLCPLCSPSYSNGEVVVGCVSGKYRRVGVGEAVRGRKRRMRYDETKIWEGTAEWVGRGDVADG